MEAYCSMIADKLALVLPYLALVLSICIWPLLLRLPAFHSPQQRSLNIFTTLLLLGSVALLIARGVHGLFSPIALSLILLLPLRGASELLTGLASLPMLAGVVWWTSAHNLSAPRATLFVALAVSATSLPFLLERGRLPFRQTMLVLGGLGLLACLPMGIYAEPRGLFTLWHHWGAYVAPADALIGGGVPFRDFPVQYGMGPTMLIVALCSRGDCWTSLYYIASIANIAYLMFMGGSAVLLAQRTSLGFGMLGVAAMGAAVLLWTTFPPDMMTWVATPSVGGLRFLPIAAIIFYIICSEVHGEGKTAYGHLLWFLGLAWSPESAFHVSLLWWPYLAIRRADGVNRFRPLAISVFASASMAAIALSVAVSVLVLAFRLGFGDWPSLTGYLTYVRNPPGILAPNLTGPVWLLIAAALGGLLGISRVDAQQQREVFVSTGALIVASSYWLGRSHDNNVLNLFPFMVLALIPLLAQPARNTLSGISRTILAGVVIYPATFGINLWRETLRDGDWSIIGPGVMLADIRLETTSAEARLDDSLSGLSPQTGRMSDAGAALEWLRSRAEGPPLFVTPHYLQIRGMTGPTWTGMSNLSTYALLPTKVVTGYIQRGSKSYNKPGWMLIDNNHPGAWLELFGTDYNVTTKRRFGSFTAYRLMPK